MIQKLPPSVVLNSKKKGPPTGQQSQYVSPNSSGSLQQFSSKFVLNSINQPNTGIKSQYQSPIANSLMQSAFNSSSKFQQKGNTVIKDTSSNRRVKAPVLSSYNSNLDNHINQNKTNNEMDQLRNAASRGELQDPEVVYLKQSNNGRKNMGSISHNVSPKDSYNLLKKYQSIIKSNKDPTTM